jgi:hypothetical protein
MFDRLRKSGVRGDGMSIMYDEVFDKLEFMKATEQMRALCVNPSLPVARGSPACDQEALEIFPCAIRAKQALIDTSNAVACGKTV